LAGTFVIGQVLIVIQVAAGVSLLAWGNRPADSTHYLYGATAILILPFAWSYLRARDQRQALLFYSLVALFIAGLAVRGITTGG
jgi:tryptophan-rich sensory protein